MVILWSGVLKRHQKLKNNVMKFDQDTTSWRHNLEELPTFDKWVLMDKSLKSPDRFYYHYMITVPCHRRMNSGLEYYPLKMKHLLRPDHVLAQTSANIVQCVFSIPAKIVAMTSWILSKMSKCVSNAETWPFYFKTTTLTVYVNSSESKKHPYVRLIVK